jgi:hypothetical protein
MNIEVEVYVGSDPFVVSCDMDEFASIGRKKFIEAGKFEYERFEHWLTRDELVELAGALLFIADHMPCDCDEETTENEETGE